MLRFLIYSVGLVAASFGGFLMGLRTGKLLDLCDRRSGGIAFHGAFLAGVVYGQIVERLLAP